MQMTKKRAVINLTEDQYERLARAADKVGMSVPGYIKLRALEAANAD